MDATTLAKTGRHKTLQYLKKQSMFMQQRLLKKPIFIYILKCGGTRVEGALGLPKTHDTALTRRRRVGAVDWEKAFTFSVVRHPYSKVISHYHFRRKHDGTCICSDGIGLNDWIARAHGDHELRYYDKALWFAPCAS